MQELSTFKLIDRISTLVRSEERKKYTALGLQPIQGQIIDYLAQCNNMSDTPAAVAEYFGLTKGTVSQSLQVLERKGYIEKKPNEQDRRILHLRLSAAGESVLKEMQAYDIYHAAEQAIPKEQFDALNQALLSTLLVLQKSNNLKSFGVCYTCYYFSELDQHYQCDLMQQSLNQQDALKICREHVLFEGNVG
ncbi:MarR family winged helix-turn-helix transcriptional regulator [Methylotuvimicrobium sp. KM1]|uniref:MarR family winged helix-turn-helix transcriptional regulator n=1 Tax=Methylotuvimicrobium sp. KM1 TaxID=3377707 RepID=UPI00384CC31B